jgi:hypothetical protein
MKGLRSLAVLAVAGGLFVHAAVFYLIKVDVHLDPREQGTRLGVRFLGDLGLSSDPVIRDQAILFDSAPLFMPSRWNAASQMSAVASLQEATEVFSPFDPVISLPQPPPELADPISQSAPSRQSLLPASPGFFLSLLDRQALAPTPSRSTTGAIAGAYPVSAQSGAVPLHIDLPPAVLADSPGALWEAAVFYVHILGGRVAGIPRMDRGSGFADWDQRLKEHMHTLTFYRHLADGYYRIMVYP